MCVDTARQRSAIPISISEDPLNEEKCHSVLFCQTRCLKPLKISHLHSLGSASHSSVCRAMTASLTPAAVCELPPGKKKNSAHGRGLGNGFCCAGLKIPLWINYGAKLEDLLQPFRAEKHLFSGSCFSLPSSPLSHVCDVVQSLHLSTRSTTWLLAYVYLARLG